MIRETELIRVVVGEMTWNPQTLRWEGNEGILRDFDPPTAPTVRPALITHLTGSSMTGATPGTLSSSGPNVGSTASLRIVGDMKFDPEKMCWVSTLAREDDEPDPFEGMADDEDEEAGGTIRASGSGGRKLVSVGGGGMMGPGTATTGSISTGWSISSRLASEASSTMSWEERARGKLGVGVHPASGLGGVDGMGGGGDGEGRDGGLVTKALWEECKEAEERHRREIRGWTSRGVEGERETRERERREERRLWEIRVLATRS